MEPCGTPSFYQPLVTNKLYSDISTRNILTFCDFANFELIKYFIYTFDTKHKLCCI